ncbi:MAG TPA: asparagine synthase (glutamine-hydrolyzing) [Alphaproteobacteria bacterium]|jgi:asparagine synthase (glutamine-hydrolysing)
MCGIAGFLDRACGSDAPTLAAAARRMGDALRYRGPDSEGTWVDAAAGLALAHRRLSIIDVSAAGHQPMPSSCGRFVISYNGELYNTAELRAELQAAGRSFKGHSDTEVIVEGCAAWGVEETVVRLRGMFAIALWDVRERRLFLVRDRLGIKPLYWGRFGTAILFGSELKALARHGAWVGDVDREALALYLRFGYVPAPYSIWRNVRKLQPGHILAVDAAGTVTETAYWSAEDVAKAGIASRSDRIDDGEAVERFDALLRDSVARHMVSDVALGAFLSGGYDSTAVVALMQAQSPRPIKTFTIGFREQAYNEAGFAKALAQHIGTDHTELYVEPQHALDVIPNLPDMYDEPFGDSSQIPTFLVCEIARRDVVVTLSGDGGDELLGGYERYAQAQAVWGAIGRVPRPLRHLGGAALGAMPAALLGRLTRHAHGAARIEKLAAILKGGEDALYLALTSLWTDAGTLARGAGMADRSPWNGREKNGISDFLDRMQYIDLVTYLPDDILTKVDRASMAVSLEARVPLLDHHVVEYAWSLPQRMKVRGAETKWLLRRVLDRYVPRALLERKKMGFGVPVGAWLRGPLKDWGEALLAEDRLAREGYLDPVPIRRRWQEHQSGKADWQYSLWPVLMFQAWLERQATLRQPLRS